jgi:hypothetical protein
MQQRPRSHRRTLTAPGCLMCSLTWPSRARAHQAYETIVPPLYVAVEPIALSFAFSPIRRTGLLLLATTRGALHSSTAGAGTSGGRAGHAAQCAPWATQRHVDRQGLIQAAVLAGELEHVRSWRELRQVCVRCEASMIGSCVERPGRGQRIVRTRFASSGAGYWILCS